VTVLALRQDLGTRTGVTSGVRVDSSTICLQLSPQVVGLKRVQNAYQRAEASRIVDLDVVDGIENVSERRSGPRGPDRSGEPAEEGADVYVHLVGKGSSELLQSSAVGSGDVRKLQHVGDGRLNSDFSRRTRDCG